MSRWRDAMLVQGADMLENADGFGVAAVHVYPDYGDERAHVDREACWCEPTVEFVAGNGSKLWLHRREQ